MLYLRLSQSDDASTSIKRQKADLIARAKREGWDVVLILVDDGFSGGKTREKALQALEMIRTGEADVLAVWKFDRWTRQGLGALAQLIDALEANPRSLFIADRDGLASSQPSWRIIASVLAEVARMERENTQIRVRSSIAELVKDGRYAGGNVPYGYMTAENPDGPGRILVPNPAEAKTVRHIAARLVAGHSLYKIMLDLNKRRVPTRRAKTTRWSATVLRQMMISDAIVGRVVHHGELVRDDDGMPVQVWDPVLDLFTWRRVRAILDADRPVSERKRRTRRAKLLSGIARCGECTQPLYPIPTGKGYYAYRCSAKSNGLVCIGAGMRGEHLERFVTSQFLEQFGDREMVEYVEVIPEETELADVESAITVTAAKMADDDADMVALTGQLKALKKRRTELKSRPATRTVTLVPTGKTYAEVWEEANDEARNALLDENIALLTLRHGKAGPVDLSRITLAFQPPRLPEDAKPGRGKVYAQVA